MCSAEVYRWACAFDCDQNASWTVWTVDSYCMTGVGMEAMMCSCDGIKGLVDRQLDFVSCDIWHLAEWTIWHMTFGCWLYGICWYGC